MNGLIDAFRRRKVPEPYPTEIAQRHLRRKAVAHAVDHRLRQQHLAAVRRAHDPGRAVYGAAKVIAVAVLDDAAMESAAHAKRRAACHRRIMERSLQVQCGGERAPCVVEDGKETVAGHLDHCAAVRLDGVSRQRIVEGERLRHPRFILLPQCRAALDIGEEKRHLRCRWRHANARVRRRRTGFDCFRARRMLVHGLRASFAAVRIRSPCRHAKGKYSVATSPLPIPGQGMQVCYANVTRVTAANSPEERDETSRNASAAGRSPGIPAPPARCHRPGCLRSQVSS